MLNNQVLGAGLIGLSVVVIMVLVCREIICWYLKINRAILILEKIEEKMLKDSDGKDNTILKTDDKTIDKTLYDTMKSINDKFKI